MAHMYTFSDFRRKSDFWFQLRFSANFGCNFR